MAACVVCDGQLCLCKLIEIFVVRFSRQGHSAYVNQGAVKAMLVGYGDGPVGV